MSWGWENPGAAAGYEVALLSIVQGIGLDDAGIAADPIVEPCAIAFRNVLEVPLPDELEIYASDTLKSLTISRSRSIQGLFMLPGQRLEVGPIGCKTVLGQSPTNPSKSNS